MSQTATSLAGLGLFMSGLHLLSQGMQAVAGRRARALLGRVTGGASSAALTGVVLGSLTQSTSAAAFICIGLLDAGALSLAGAMTLSAWASVGTSLLVFLAAVDVRLIGLYAIACVALAYLFNLNRHPTARHLVTLAFALGTLMLGLGLIKDGAAALRASPWVIEFFEFSAESPAVALLIGVIVTLIAQSSATVSVLAVTLNLSGVLPVTEALLLVCGASLGSGLSVALVTSHLVGVPRQLALWQCVVKVLGVALILPWLLVFPDPQAAWTRVTEAELPVSTLVACVYLLLQVAGALAGGLLQTRGLRLVQRLAGTHAAAARFSPKHLYADAARYPETALTLADQEQRELMRELPRSLDPLRLAVDPEAEILSNDDWHQGAGALNTRIAEFIAETTAMGGADEWVARIFALQGRNETLRSLLDALHGFVQTLDNEALREGLAASMTESLHLILSLLAEQVAEGEDNSDILQELTSDRSDLMEQIRGALLAQAGEGQEARQALFIATGIFERILWLARRLAQPLAG
ncbi:MAG: Na/Pi cotransporter family protein [Gammaproteobacteria bacterium]|nr:Na/Pi cotransporter family protein [Gammaproteobacteria bacterium]